MPRRRHRRRRPPRQPRHRGHAQQRQSSPAAEPDPVPSDRSAPTTRRPIWRRLVPLGVAGAGFYVVWPSLRQTWGAAPTLQDAHPGWLLVLGALQVASYLCMWRLQQVAMDTPDFFLVSTSQLTGNAVGKILPGGGAAAAALQHQTLVRGGVDPVRSRTGVTVVALLTNGLVFLLPLASLPTILGPTPVPGSLLRTALVGLLIAVVLGGAATALATSDPLVRRLGRLLDWVAARLRRPDTDLADRLVDERALLMQFLGAPRAGLVVLAFVAAFVLGSVPITPGGLGFVEAGLTATLTVSGIPAATAAAAGLAYRLASYWLPLAAGAAASLAFSRRHGRIPGTLSDTSG